MAIASAERKRKRMSHGNSIKHARSRYMNSVHCASLRFELRSIIFLAVFSSELTICSTKLNIVYRCRQHFILFSVHMNSFAIFQLLLMLNTYAHAKNCQIKVVNRRYVHVWQAAWGAWCSRLEWYAPIFLRASSISRIAAQIDFASSGWWIERMYVYCCIKRWLIVMLLQLVVYD